MRLKGRVRESINEIKTGTGIDMKRLSRDCYFPGPSAW